MYKTIQRAINKTTCENEASFLSEMWRWCITCKISKWTTPHEYEHGKKPNAHLLDAFDNIQHFLFAFIFLFSMT